MGLFGSKKINFGELYPDVPDYTLASGSADQYLGGVDQLVNTFQNRANGTDMFDYIKFMFEPQATELAKYYGMSDNPDDVYSSMSGVLPQTLASMNKRGLLDTGTSGVVEGQLRSNYADKKADLYGTAKQYQKNDVDSALSALGELFPARFNVANIPSQVNYMNQMNDFNQGMARNQATSAWQQAQVPWYQTLFQAGGNALGNYFGAGNVGTDLFGNGNTGTNSGLFTSLNKQPVSTASTNQTQKDLNNWFDDTRNTTYNDSSRVNSQTPGFAGFFGGTY